MDSTAMARVLKLSLVVAAVAATPVVDSLSPATAAAATPELMRCQPPAPGRYAVLGSGTQGKEPVAVLMQERWLADGRLEGVRYWRQGRRFAEDRYSGQIKTGSDCWVSIERRGPAGAMLSADTLNGQGQPQSSLVTHPNGALSLRYVNQGEQRCDRAQLNGLVTSQQQGQSWLRQRWQTNAVVQREWWQGGLVNGMALSSNAGRITRATYSGRLQLGADCLGVMRQQDSKGNAYNYKVLLLSRGSGYIYLQTDPDDLTLGLLQRQR